MNAILAQVGIPSITAPQVAMWVGIVGLFVLLFKFGAIWGAMQKDVAGLRAEVQKGFERVDVALTRSTDAMTALSALVTALSVQVAQHERLLNRADE